jgi:tellurite resistance protein TerC
LHLFLSALSSPLNVGIAVNMDLFPFAQYWWLYGSFTIFVLGLLALDLGVFHRKAHAVSYKEAAIWSVVWIALALIFNYALYLYSAWQFSQDPRLAAIPGFSPESSARQIALEFLTGYIIEKTLSIDNIFLFVIVFGFFAVPRAYQHRILFFGVLGALVFRGIFIALGSALLAYHWIIWIFGGFLILTGVKMLFAPEISIHPDRNPVLRLFRKLAPVTSEPHGQKLFVRLKGKIHATPFLLALLFIELSDVVFAIDSVPAIFAITREPLIVFTSNVFAILGLRSLYFMLAGAVNSFHMLKYGLGFVLIFVGLKMAWLNQLFGGKFPIGYSLGIIAAMIGSSITLSLLFPKKPKPA